MVNPKGSVFESLDNIDAVKLRPDTCHVNVFQDMDGLLDLISLCLPRRIFLFFFCLAISSALGQWLDHTTTVSLSNAANVSKLLFYFSLRILYVSMMLRFTFRKVIGVASAFASAYVYRCPTLFSKDVVSINRYIYFYKLFILICWSHLFSCLSQAPQPNEIQAALKEENIFDLISNALRLL